MKLFLLILMLAYVESGTWVPTGNNADCWGVTCQSTSMCWRPDDFDIPQLCLVAPLDPNTDWPWKLQPPGTALVETDTLLLFLLIAVGTVVSLLLGGFGFLYFKLRRTHETVRDAEGFLLLIQRRTGQLCKKLGVKPTGLPAQFELEESEV